MEEPIAVYDYTDCDGNLLFQVCRFEPKRFLQRRPDGKGGYEWDLSGVKLVPYNLPNVLKSDLVFICEGEKDCDSLAKIGLCGTCNPMGAGKWLKEFNEYLTGKRIVILPDNDEAGIKHAEEIASLLFNENLQL